MLFSILKYFFLFCWGWINNTKRVVNHRLWQKTSVFILQVFICVYVSVKYLYQIFSNFIYNSNGNWIKSKRMNLDSLWRIITVDVMPELFSFGLCACKWFESIFVLFNTSSAVVANEWTKKGNTIWPMCKCLNEWNNEWTLWHHLTFRLRLRLRSIERILHKIISRYYVKYRYRPKKSIARNLHNSNFI